MTPKQMARLGVFQIQEAILSVLEQEPEGLEPEGISTTLGVPDCLIVQGVLAKLQREGYVEPAVGERWKIVSSDDSNIWTTEGFRKLISGERYEETYISKGQIESLSKFGADLMNLVTKEEWNLCPEFKKNGCYFFFNRKRLFGVKTSVRLPRLCIWLPEDVFIAKENDLISTGEIDRRYERYCDFDGGYARYPADVEVANIEALLEFTYLYRTGQLD